MSRAKAFLFVPALLLTQCAPSPDSLKAQLLKHPEVILEVLSANASKLAEINQAGSRELNKKNPRAPEQSIDDMIKAPVKPLVESDRAVSGNRSAPIVLVAYSDFQCPYCARGYQTVEELKKKHGKKLLFVFKHLPLPFHPYAMPAAKRFEAIAMQSPEKAYKFHDIIFGDQKRLGQEKEDFLDAAAKQAGANVSRMKKDMESDKVKARIDADMAEARQFGITGTPGFVLNGVKIKGARPVAFFDSVLDRKPASN